MDSSLVMQLGEKWPICKLLSPMLNLFERVAVTSSVAVVPVCDALAAIADRHGSKDTLILRDISLLDNGDRQARSLREEVGSKSDDLLLLYVGNLESYQGIDLLFESFAKVTEQERNSKLVIIGGSLAHIELYRHRAQTLGIAQRTFLLGQRPVDRLSSYIMDADILVSPRVKGNNTPMKVYSYLHSGKPIVATDLVTHTQVLNSNVALLITPEPNSFSQALLKLLRDPILRTKLGNAAGALAENQYTFDVFRDRLNGLYDRLVGKSRAPDFGGTTSHSLAAGG